MTASAAALADDGGRATVLLVDDDCDTVALLAMVLQHAGYRVVSAANGHEALEVLRRETPALILLDIEMPEMTGQQFRVHQRQSTELLRIPTIVMTGSREEPMLDLAVRAVLRKPFSAARLLATIGEVAA